MIAAHKEDLMELVNTLEEHNKAMIQALEEMTRVNRVYFQALLQIEDQMPTTSSEYSRDIAKAALGRTHG